MTPTRVAIVATAAWCAIGLSPLHGSDEAGWTVGTMMKVKRVSAVTPSPDGRRVAFAPDSAPTWAISCQLSGATG